MDTPDPLSDAELIARVRAGDLDAYGELFGRHHQAAERMARQLVPAGDADDLAGEAFAKVLDALRNGSGPDLSFRAYLLTTVRRVHVDRLRSGHRVQFTGDIAEYERAPETFEDPTVTGFESSAAAKAFASLPERWQAVLWHTEVEGDKPAAVAPLLGLTHNGVSALAYRAREGLRQAYLQQHLVDATEDRCRWTTGRLGAYVRGGPTKRESARVRAHLDDCSRCTAVYLELVEINSSLPALLAPALLGTAGMGYLAATSGAQAGVVGLLKTGWKKATKNAARTAVTAGTGAVVVVAAILVATAATGDGKDSPASIGEPTVQPSRPVTSPTVAPSTMRQPRTAPTRPPRPTQQPRPTTVPPPADPTTALTAEPTHHDRPTTRPTRRPTLPPVNDTPILDEGLITIRTASGGNAAPVVANDSTVAAVNEYRLLTVKVPSYAIPVVVDIKHGAMLNWPVTSPRGWSCTRTARGRGGICIAKTSRAPEALRLSFTAPTGGTSRDRTFTVSARTGRLYDDDSQTLALRPRSDENLLRISARKPEPDFHLRTLTVVPPASRSAGAVRVKLHYGASLSWPIASNPPGWTCYPARKTCTATDPRRPVPLLVRFAIPKAGPAAARTYRVTATVGPVHDTDVETLSPRRLDESLLRITRPTHRDDDPNRFVYNRFIEVHSGIGRVQLDLTWGQNLSWNAAHGQGWICTPPALHRATCWTDAPSQPLNTEWNARARPNNNSPDNQLTVRASAGDRYDIDQLRIPPSNDR